MAKAYVMAQLVPNKARDGYVLRKIGIYSESSPTSTVGDIFCLLYESEGETFGKAVDAARMDAKYHGGRLLGEVVSRAR